jgi:uncharacterized protein
MLLVAGLAALMVFGLVGTIVPGIPGLLVIFGAAIVYGAVEGFGGIGTTVTVLLAGLLLAGSAASYVLPHRAGVLAGVGRSSLRLGLVGAIAGLFLIPLLGLPIGAVLGVLVGEHHRLGDWGEAWGTTRKVVIGFGLGALAEFSAGVLMIIAWIVWVVAG